MNVLRSQYTVGLERLPTPPRRLCSANQRVERYKEMAKDKTIPLTADPVRAASLFHHPNATLILSKKNTKITKDKRRRGRRSRRRLRDCSARPNVTGPWRRDPPRDIALQVLRRLLSAILAAEPTGAAAVVGLELPCLASQPLAAGGGMVQTLPEWHPDT